MTTAQERKQHERQARRRRIQRSAREVFAERGYAKTSIEQVARQASLSVGAIYLYFRSKEDLYVSLLEDTLQVFDAEMTQARAKADVGKRLEATWTVLVQWATTDVEGTRTLRLVAQPGVRAQLSDEVVTALGAGLARIREHLGACIADGIHAGLYRAVNAGDIADVLWSLFLGTLDAADMRSNLDVAATPPAETLTALLTMIETTLGTKPAAAQVKVAA